MEDLRKEYGIKDILSVSTLNHYLDKKISSDPFLFKVFVFGEVSNLRKYGQERIYFDLKDEDSLVNCVCFSTSSLSLQPEDHQEILVKASLKIFKKSSRIQLLIKEVYPLGEGILHAEFQALKKKLEQEGLFEEKHKKKLPYFPKKIGIATSSEGAAVRDIINTLTQRLPSLQILICPTIVQGEHAPKSIITSLCLLEEQNLDLIILGRGGGSFEDLHCFNDEEVIRKIHSLQTPLISAVGHERDWTLTDFVADKRAITPTHAAELAIFNKQKEQERITFLKKRIQSLKETQQQKQVIKKQNTLLITLGIILVLLILFLIWRFFS